MEGGRPVEEKKPEKLVGNQESGALKPREVSRMRAWSAGPKAVKKWRKMRA